MIVYTSRSIVNDCIKILGALLMIVYTSRSVVNDCKKI